MSRHVYGYVTEPNHGLDGLVATIIYTVTIVLTLALAHFARKRGALITLSLPSFWLLGTVATLMSMYTEIKNFDGSWNNTLGLVDDTLTVVISVVQLILSCFSEKPAPAGRTSFRSVDFCPVESAPLPSRITFSWIFGLFAKGLNNSLHQDHLIPLCSELKSFSIAKKFREYTKKYRDEQEIDSRQADLGNEHSNLLANEISEDLTGQALNESNRHFWLPDKELIKSETDQSLLCILIRSSKKFLLISFVLELFSVALFYVPSYILSLFLDYVEEDGFKWHGYAIAVTLYLSVLVSGIVDAQQRYYSLLAAMQIRSSLVNAVYSKVFRLSKTSKESRTIESIGNYIAVDTEKVFKFVNMCAQLWSAPLRISIGLHFLWMYLGPSSLMSLAVFAAVVLITQGGALRVSKLQKKRTTEKDKRLSILSEVFHGIKTLKLFAWEEPFLEKVYNIRQKELSYLRKAEYLDICLSFLYGTAPSLVALAAFVTYLLVDKNHFLDAKMVFVSLSVIHLLRFPLSSLSVIPFFIEARTAMSRVHKFLQNEELDFRAVGCNPDSGDSATIRNGLFSYSPGSDPILKNISLKVKESKLVAVIGEAGSGKTSLINALLGEMHRVGGTANLKGSVAYVAQQAWLQNTTLKQNILFMSEMRADFYHEILDACALLPDLDLLPAGDHTEIGEQGINLSSGQKQRISLARAAYQNADVYLLDDPLSAVDAQCASHLFQRVIGPQGVLKDKTRLLVTHIHAFLPQMDWIVIMKNGSIAEQGTYADLMNANGLLSIYMADVMLTNATGDPAFALEDSTSLLEMPSGGHEDNMSVENFAPSSNVDNGQQNEEENAVGVKNPWSTYLSYIQSIGCFPSMFAVLFAGLYCASEMATGVWLSDWSDNYEPSQRNYKLTVYACFVLSQGLLMILSAVVLFTGSSLSATKMHRCLLLHLIRAPQAFFDTTPIGRILKRFGKDMENVDVKIPRTLNLWMCAALWIPAVFVVISFASLYITIAFFPLILIYYGVQKLYISTSRQLHHLTSATSSPLHSHFGESLVGVTSIRTFKVVRYFITRLHERLDTYQNCFFLSIVSSRWLEVCLTVLGSFIVLIAAILSVVEHEKEPGIIGLALVYSMQITQGLSVLIRLSFQLETSMVAFERVKEYSEVKQEAEWRNPVYQPPDSWPQEGAISIQNLSTTYRERFSSVLHDINVTLKPGEKVGIVGRTGAGKSTLVLTLFRLFEPTEGAIFIDNINILCIGLHNLRSKLTIMPQDPVIFSGTVRSNLDPFHVHKDEELWQSLDQAHLRSYVMQLNGGLDHYLSKGGESLSFGQCQLLCLARCLLRKPKVLILDEATASVDVEADNLIQETVKTAFEDCTIISVVHHLSSAMDYNRVLVLACGEVVEDGCPKELILDTNSYFYNLAVEAGIVAANNQYNPVLDDEIS